MYDHKVSDQALMDLSNTKAINRDDHRFLKTIQSASGLKPHLCSWICLLYIRSQEVWQREVNELKIKSVSCCLDIFFKDVHYCLYVFVVEPFRRKRANPVLCRIITWGLQSQTGTLFVMKQYGCMEPNLTATFLKLYTIRKNKFDKNKRCHFVFTQHAIQNSVV